MTVKEWLEQTRPKAILPDLLNLLDEFAEERCSVLAGKIRAQTAPVSWEEMPEYNSTPAWSLCEDPFYEYRILSGRLQRRKR